MIIYRKSDTELIIPCGLGTVVCPDNDHSLQMKTIDSSTVLQDITPDAGYYGLYRVIVNPYELDSKTVDPSTEPQVVTSSKDGLFQVIVNPYTLESRTQAITVNGEYSFTPDNADGLSRVDISVNVADTPAVLQSKTADASTETQVVTPDEGYDGLSQVTVDPYTLESKSDTITENGLYAYYPSTADGLADVTIDVSVDTVNNQTKTVDSSTTIQYVQPDQGYTGLEYVAVNPYVLDTKTVNPSTGSQTVTSEEDGLSQVTVNPVTAAIDPDIVASNIKKDVDILGVVGTFEGGTLQSKTVDSSTVSQTVTPDGANYGLSSVTVNPYTEETVSDTITQNGQYTYTAQNADTLSEVTIDVSVADIPAVIQTKSVTYTQNGEYTVTKDAGYDGMSSVDISVNVPTQEPELQSKTVSSSTNSQTVTPDQNYDGLSSVTVNPYALENKTVNSSTTQQTISADNGYDGLNMVTVNPYTLDSKTVDSSTVSQTVTSSQDGLSSVTVNPYTTETRNASITTNGTFTYTPVSADALSEVTVDVSINAVNNQAKTADSSTVQQIVTPDNGYTGLSSVTIEPYILDTKTIDSSTVAQIVTSDEDGLSSVTVNPYILDAKTVDASIASVTVNSSEDGLSQVTVNAVTAAIDPNIKDYNIVEGVTILGVTGSRHIANLQLVKYADSSTSVVDVYPDHGYDGMRAVYVRPYHLNADSSVLTQNGQYVFEPAAGYNGLSQVTVDVSINTVNNQNKTVDSSTVSQSVTADNGYTGLGTVTVNPYTTETDSSVLTANGQYVFTPNNADALSEVTVDVSVDATPNLQPKVITATTTFPAVILPDPGYDGFSEIDIDIQGVDYDCNSTLSDASVQDSSTYNVYAYVDRINILSKMVDPVTVDSSTVSQTINPVRDAISQVTVNPYTTETKSATLTANGTYTYIPTGADALSEVTIDVSINTAPTLQSKTVNSSTSQQAVQADSGYDGLSQVVVNPYVLDSKTVDSSTVSQTVTSSEDGLSSVTVNPYTVEADSSTLTANGHYEFTPVSADALSKVEIDVSVNTVNNQSKTANSSTSSQTITPDNGYTGLSSVTVNPYTVEADSSTLTANGTYVFTPVNADALREVTVDVSIDTVNNQSKTADSSTVSQTVTPDNGYTGLSSVTINPYTTETDTSTLTANGRYEFLPQNADALASVVVDVSVEGQAINNQSKTVDSSTVGQTVSPDYNLGYTGLGKVDVNPYVLDTSTVNPSTNTIIVTSAADGLSQVTVNAVSNAIDSNITAGNIRDGVTILGVSGTYAGNNQSKTVDSSTVAQSITPDQGYTGLGKVDINPYVLDTKTVNPSTNSQTVTSSEDGLSSVTVNAVTSSIDQNIAAGNIKDGVTILGVTGTYTGTVADYDTIYAALLEI